MQAGSSGEVDANASANAATNSNSTVGKYRDTDPAFGKYGDADRYGNTSSGAPPVMLGARAGLHLVKPSTANCRCLSVIVGAANEPSFTWQGPVPKTDPAVQLVVGLSSEGLPCPDAAADSLGASYRGYDVVGNDVVVQVETARLGRPIAQGAIVPKPPAGGRILVSAVDAKSPYGRSADGKSVTCNVWSTP